MAEPTVRIVGTCDWGNCDASTVAVRFDGEEWLSVCEEHTRGVVGYRLVIHRLKDEDWARGGLDLTKPHRRDRYVP